MDRLWTSDSVISNSYFNVSLLFLLRTCRPRQPLDLTAAEEVGEDGQDADLSLSLSDLADWFTGAGEKEENAASDHYSWREEGDNCHDFIHTDVGGAVSVISLIKIVLGLVLAVALFQILWRKLRGKKGLSERGKTHVEHTDVQEDTPVSMVGPVSLDEKVVSETSSTAAVSKPKVPMVIPLVGGGRGSHSADSCSFVSQPDSGQFLAQTADHLVAQLDWMLGVTAADQSSPGSQTMSAMASSLVTPRLQRKGSIRRPRWRTLTSLPLESVGQSSDEDMSVRMWQKVSEMEKRMGWTQLDLGDLDINAVHDNRLSAILQFYQQTCPVRTEQWNASCLIVNYLLTVLEQELISGISDRSPLKVMELQSFGSATNAACISRANRFNVMMVLQLPFCSEMSVYDCEVCDDIPAGRLVLGVKETGGVVTHLVQKDRIGDSFGSFLSVREVLRMSQKLLMNTIDRLKLKNKLILDRLSFNMHLNQYNDLQLCIDTRMLNGLGFGLSEITLQLTPALRVSSEENYPLPALYAIPPWNFKPSDSSDEVRSRLQSRIMRSHTQGVPSDLLWQLNCCELTKSFMSSAKGKLKSAGVSGCQVMCQQILRAVFSRSGKDTLLTTGELHPHVLDSVIYFLLLESPVSSWNLHCLPDRFSDCVHFLRSAVQSCWMPGFMLHNPHLLKQMPALQLLPLLRSRRQENLLASVRSEEVENILSFMESRLQETGLKRCVKEDYSTEMWEYEFFIFG